MYMATEIENPPPNEAIDGQNMSDDTQPLADLSAPDLAESIIDMRTLSQQEGGLLLASSQPNTTAISWNGKRYPLLMSQTPAYLARHLLNHNRLNGYSLGVFIGRSGSGKSTYTQTLAHYFHTVASQQGLSYSIDWFKQKDIEHLDSIIEGMEKGIDRVLIFEDASFTFNNMKQNEIEEVMAKLTFIRHTLQAHVVIMVQIHYTKALEKFMRDGDLTMFTSITFEERENMLKLYGSRNSYTVNKFFQRYHEQNVNGRFFVEYGGYTTTKSFRYKTNEPFRIAMVNDFGKLHFALYHKASCEFCAKRFKTHEHNNANTQTLTAYLQSAGGTYGLSKLRTTLKYYFYFKEGIDQLEPRSKYLVKKTAKFFHDNPEAYANIRDRMKGYVSLDTIMREAGIVDSRTDTKAEQSIQKKLGKLKNKEARALEKRELAEMEEAQGENKTSV